MTDLRDCSKSSHSAPSHAAAPAARPAHLLSGTGRTLLAVRQRILIVEDDCDLAATMAIGLERAGYDVAIASDPEHALQALAVMPDSWSLVIADHHLLG
jgi:DNA-binding NtrC family response regulator